jgi:hypothetical protein
MNTRMFMAAVAVLALSPLTDANAAPDQIVPLLIDTSSVAGTTGSIDLQFNPGPNIALNASVAVLGFQGATSTFDQQTGSVSGGPLPNTVTLNNLDVLNEDLEGLNFGNSITLTLDFSGPAINSPGSAPSGSVFTLGLFSDPGATMPLPIDPTGIAFAANINPNGQFTTLIVSPEVSIVPAPLIGYGFPVFLAIGGVLFGVKLGKASAGRISAAIIRLNGSARQPTLTGGGVAAPLWPI